MQKYLKLQLKHLAKIFICLLPMLLYSSWVLGYALNPTVAKTGTASELAAYGEPHRNVFVFGDYAFALALLWIGVMALRRPDKQKILPVLFYMLSGICTAIAAFVALNCAESGADLSCQVEGSRLLAHNIFGSLASISLFFAMQLLLPRIKRNKKVSIFAQVLMFIWACLGVISILLSVSSNLGQPVAVIQRLFLFGTAIVAGLVAYLILKKNA